MATTSERKRFLLICLIVLSVGLIVFVVFYKQNFSNKLNQRELEKSAVLDKAIEHFELSMDRYSSIVAKMQTFVNTSAEMPSAEEFQSFAKQQVSDINYTNALLVTYISDKHVIKYVFTTTGINHLGISNSSLVKLRSKDDINSLNELMQTEYITLYPPAGTVEGWLGFPFLFRVKKRNEILGYVAVVFEIEPVIRHLYDQVASQNFTLRFSSDSLDFDRERIYDGSLSYTEKKDNEYYKNFNIEPSKFLNKEIELYGRNFNIGVAYKQPFELNKSINVLFFVGIGTTIALMLILYTGYRN